MKSIWHSRAGWSVDSEFHPYIRICVSIELKASRSQRRVRMMNTDWHSLIGDIKERERGNVLSIINIWLNGLLGVDWHLHLVMLCHLGTRRTCPAWMQYMRP